MQLMAIQCNVTEDDQVTGMARVVDELLMKYDATLFTLVNNARIADPGDFAFFCGTNMEVAKQVMEVNYFCMLHVTGQLFPLMMQTSTIQDDGMVSHPCTLKMSYVCDVSASPENSRSNTFTFAIEVWSDSLRIELKKIGIEVTKI
eukprot:1990921-Ditylum_brightwellii.AAC.2